MASGLKTTKSVDWIEEKYPAQPYYMLIQERRLASDAQLKISQVGLEAADLKYCPTIFDQKDMEVMEYLIDNMDKFDGFVNFQQLIDSYQLQLEIVAYNNGGRINATPLSRSRTIMSKNVPAPEKFESEGVDETCAVCLAVIGNEDGEREDVQVRELKCKHYFHVKCIDMWLVEQQRCPYCKTIV